MEDTDPDTAQAEVLYKPRHDKERPAGLHGKGAGKNMPRHSRDPAHRPDIVGCLQQQTFFQADPFSHDQEKQDREDNNAQASGLNKDEDNDLSEEGPLGKRRYCHQAGHADSGRRCEQRVDEPRFHARRGRDRQHKKDGAAEDRDKKPVCQDPGG